MIVKDTVPLDFVELVACTLNVFTVVVVHRTATRLVSRSLSKAVTSILWSSIVSYIASQRQAASYVE